MNTFLMRYWGIILGIIAGSLTIAAGNHLQTTRLNGKFEGQFGFAPPQSEAEFMAVVPMVVQKLESIESERIHSLKALEDAGNLPARTLTELQARRLAFENALKQRDEIILKQNDYVWTLYELDCDRWHDKISKYDHLPRGGGPF